MNPLQSIYDIEIANNKFLVAILQDLAEIKGRLNVEMKSDSQQSCEVVGERETIKEEEL